MLIRQPQHSIAHGATTRANNFDLIRLTAALLVLFSHCFPLTGQTWEPLEYATGGLEQAGSLGVMTFFVVSGFLVMRSVMERSPIEFLEARALRILPLFLVVTIFDVALGAFLTTLDLRTYLAHELTIAHAWNPVFVKGISFALPGVFETLPIRAVNGSLWSMVVEVGFYAVLFVWSLVRLCNRWFILGAWAGSVSLHLLVFPAIGVNAANPGPLLWPGAQMFFVAKLATGFLGGAALWLWRDHVPLRGDVALVLAGAIMVTLGTPLNQAAYILGLPYLVIYLALLPPLAPRLFQVIGDLSYGTYLFAFPVQQTLVWTCGPSIGPVTLALMATPVVLVIAALGWRTIERPALALRRSRRSIPHEAPARV